MGNTFNLTFSECKRIIEAGLDLRGIAERLNDQPDWLEAMGGINTLSDLQSIMQGGCASGAFMPAVTSYTANKVMADYGNDVVEYLYNEIGEVPQLDAKRDSWAGYAVKLLSAAVELWSGQFDDLYDIEAC